MNINRRIMENEKPITKKIKILVPTTKIVGAVKCKNTEEAYQIFKYILKYEKYELKDQGLAAA